MLREVNTFPNRTFFPFLHFLFEPKNVIDDDEEKRSQETREDEEREERVLQWWPGNWQLTSILSSSSSLLSIHVFLDKTLLYFCFPLSILFYLNWARWLFGKRTKLLVVSWPLLKNCNVTWAKFLFKIFNPSGTFPFRASQSFSLSLSNLSIPQVLFSIRSMRFNDSAKIYLLTVSFFCILSFLYFVTIIYIILFFSLNLLLSSVISSQMTSNWFGTTTSQWNSTKPRVEQVQIVFFNKFKNLKIGSKIDSERTTLKLIHHIFCTEKSLPFHICTLLLVFVYFSGIIIIIIL